MQLPNWFKILWWVGITLALVMLLSTRILSIQEGTANAIDAFLFLILLILLLLPLFKEFDFLGLKLKAQIDEVKTEIKDEVTQLRNEIISIGVNTQVNPQIYLNPPPDSQLPDLERKYQKILDELRKERNISGSIDVQTELLIPTDVNYLFIVRYTIEKELRRIWRDRFNGEITRRPVPVHKILGLLVEAGLIESRISNMIREVYSVCSPAIHGEEVSEKQISFVRDIAPNLISTLIEIK